MFQRCSRRGSSRSISAVAGAASTLLVVLSGCSTVDGDGAAKPGQVAAYQSDLSASRQAAVRAEGVALCRQSMASIGMMVRGFNDFMVRLNAVQDYNKLGDLDDKARATLIAGADQIRPKVTAQTPADVAEPARVYLDTSGRLGDVIAKREKGGINALAVQWTQQRDRFLTACVVYVPNPPAPSPAPVPPPATGQPPTAPPSAAPPTSVPPR